MVTPPAPPPPPPPNILFIMSDQQRYDAMSAHGGWIQTPNLDRLAATGVDLHGHYAQAPVCVPSRCSLFSGRYGHAHGILENDRRLDPGERHLFKVLRESGYYQTYSGKNHLLPEDVMRAMFDKFDGYAETPNPSAQRLAYLKMEHESLSRLRTHGSHATGMFHDFPDDVTSTGMVTNDVLANLNAAPSDRPWCVVASYSDPHVPHLAPRRFESLYPPDKVPVPALDPTEFDGKPPRVPIKRAVQLVEGATEEQRHHYLAVYGAMCSFVDEQVGRLMDALAARPDAARTIVVFVSDHGDFGWHHGMVKKDLILYDDLLHVPAIISWPAELRARVVDGTLTEHVDIMPTLLELAGLPVPSACQGRSMVRLLRGETTTHRDEIHAEVCYEWMRCEYETAEEFRDAWQKAHDAGEPLGRSAPYNVPGDFTRGVRTKEWKYIWYGSGFEELYNLKSDPAEVHSVARDPANAAVLEDMRGRLKAWQESTPGG